MNIISMFITPKKFWHTLLKTENKKNNIALFVEVIIEFLKPKKNKNVYVS